MVVQPVGHPDPEEEKEENESQELTVTAQAFFEAIDRGSDLEEAERDLRTLLPTDDPRQGLIAEVIKSPNRKSLEALAQAIEPTTLMHLVDKIAPQ